MLLALSITGYLSLAFWATR